MSSEAVKTLIQAFISCRLDYCNSLLYGIRHHRRSDEPAAVGSKCGRTFGIGRLTLRPRNAGVKRDALTSGSASGGFQDGHSGLFVTVRHGSSFPGRRLSAGLRRRLSSAAFFQFKNMCRQTDLHQLWRHILCCCRAEAVEQASSSSETTLNSLISSCWKHFCLGAESAAHCG